MPTRRGSFAPSPRKVAISTRIASATRSARRLLATGRERSGHLFRAVTLDDVVDLDVVEVLDTDTALEAFLHLAHVVLEPLERRDDALVHLDALAHHAHARLAVDHPAAHHAAGDGADLRDLEDLADLRLAQDDFALLGTQHPLERGAHVVHRLVDDAIELDVHPFALGRRAGVVVRAHVEADDDGVLRRLGEEDVALADGADAAVDDLHRDL